MTKCQADLPQSGHYAVLLLCFPTAEGGRAKEELFLTQFCLLFRAFSSSETDSKLQVKVLGGGGEIR